MNAPAPTVLLLAALAICFPSAAHAQDGSPEPVAPFLNVEFLSSGEEAAVLAEGIFASGASAIVAVNQVLVGNRVVEDGIHSLALIQNSFNGGTGIFGVNQDAGNFNNQANVVAFAMAAGEPVAQVLSLSIDAEKRDNVIISSNSTHQERIDGSFNGTTGIVGVNQSAGSANNQVNAVAIGVGVMLASDAIVLHDTDLETVTGDEQVVAEPEPVNPTITDSFQDFRGIAQVSQASGNLNTVRNVLSVSVIAVGGAQP